MKHIWRRVSALIQHREEKSVTCDDLNSTKSKKRSFKMFGKNIFQWVSSFCNTQTESHAASEKMPFVSENYTYQNFKTKDTAVRM